MVYGDSGRYPLYIDSCKNARWYWLNLLQMDNKLPYNAYQMSLELDENGKECWVSKIKEL